VKLLSIFKDQQGDAEMKKAVTGLMVAVFALAMVSTDVLAKGAKGAKGGAKNEGPKAATTVDGTLALVKNDKGEVTGITITTKSGTAYNVDMAGFAQDCSALDGQEVEAKGTLKEADGKSTLTVQGQIGKPKAKAEGKKKGKK